MIALEECFYPVGRQVILGIQALGGVAITANLCGDFQRGAALEPDNFVFGMAIGASRCVAVPGGDGFAVDALLDIPGGLFMTSAAGLGQARKMKRRLGRSRWQNGMTVMTVTAAG